MHCWGQTYTPVYSASDSKGEVAPEVWLVGGGDDGVGSSPQAASQAHLLGVTVRHAAHHRLLV